MGIITAILGETDFEVPTTVRVLERVPQDNLDWTPHPKSMTIGRLAWHVANIPARVQQMLRAGDFDVAAAGPPPMPSDASEFPATLQRNMDELREYLRTLDDEALKAPFTLRHGEQVLQKIPKAAVLRSILLNHTYHHRGQLAVYLRLLDIPVPAIYGTSADEGPLKKG
ncbi:MAG TPA: DinB family protein [Thermoanaerobaculia bacterium]|nr:DinB family protein [Thermoanaerobaculia bacterium]